MIASSVVVCTALLAAAFATDVQQCRGRSVAGLSDSVQLSPCKKPPCRLKKGSNQHISITFTPDTDVPEVINSVSAEVFGLPLPFIGVDGNSVCDKIFTESGEKAPCPLKSGTKYVYKDSFPILAVYPSTSVKVHWALKNKEQDITCFEVPAFIR